MIRDARALDTTAVPRRLVHRAGEIDALTTALRPLEDGDQPDNARSFGPTGVGKTTPATFVLRKLDCVRERDTLGVAVLDEAAHVAGTGVLRILHETPASRWS